MKIQPIFKKKCGNYDIIASPHFDFTVFSHCTGHTELQLVPDYLCVDALFCVRPSCPYMCVVAFYDAMLTNPQAINPQLQNIVAIIAYVSSSRKKLMEASTRRIGITAEVVVQ